MTSHLFRLSAVFAAAVSFASMAHAATDPSAIQAAYERQRAACNAGKSTEDRATCLKEAGAAYEQAKQGKLTNDGDFRKNEMDRCKVFRDASDRRECVARLQDPTAVSGSVAGGGIIREEVTKEVVRPAMVIPAPASAPN